MPRLGDFLGALASEVTLARAQADMEAVRIAEHYLADDLLKFFPVPRFRLPNVKVELRVAVTGLEEVDGERPPRGTPSLDQLLPQAIEVVDAAFSSSEPPLSQSEKALVRAAIEEALKALERPPEFAIGVVGAADRIARSIGEALRQGEAPAGEGPGGRRVPVGLRFALKRSFLAQYRAPERLVVEVLKRSSSTLDPVLGEMHLQLELHEEGLEWTDITDDRGVTSRLIAE